MEKELIVLWRIKESETRRILTLIPELAEATKAEAGNKAYAVYQSEADPNLLILHERYADNQAVETHRNSAHYQRIVTQEIMPHLASREVNFVKKLL